MIRKVAVFFGGKSCENEISILTAVFVLRLIDREKYEPVPLYIHTDGNLYTSKDMFDLNAFKENNKKNFQRVFLENGVLYAFYPTKHKIKRLTKIDVALNCCHGGLGEGGGVAALAEWNGIPFASPDLTSSGIFMDKGLTKLAARALNIPTVDYIRVNEQDYLRRGAFLLKNIQSRLKYPVVIKPSHLGSSIGITVAKNEAEAKAACDAAFQLDNRVIIEKYLADKKDVNCAACCIRGEICVSEAEEAFGDGIYSFEEKYVKRTADGAKGGGRCVLNGDLRDKIRAYTKTLYKRLNLSGVVRMDFLVSDNKAYLCEVNTVPGSLAYYLFCERITDARNFFSDLIEEALRSTSDKKVLSTGILRKVKWLGK